MDGLFITSNEGADWRGRLQIFLKEHETKRIHVSVRVFEDHCSKCGKAIPPGSETEYCGRTYCFHCKDFEEEIDEDCS